MAEANIDALDLPERNAPPDVASVASSPYTSSAPELGSFLPTAKQHTDAIRDERAATEEKLGIDTKTNDFFTARMGKRIQQTEAAYSAEAASARSLPPEWNADKERADRIRGPFERFGDVATVFAMLASGFSRQPMTSALNAGAAAMNAVAAHDEDGYEKAYTAWKDNTALAVKRFDMQHTLFNDSEHLFNTDLKAWHAINTANAAKYDDKRKLALLQNGMYPELFKLEGEMVKNADAMRESMQAGELYNNQKAALKEIYKQIDTIHGPDGADPWNPWQMANARSLAAQNQMVQSSKTGAADKLISEGQYQYFLDHGREMPPTEQAELIRRSHGWGSGGAGGNPNLTSQRSIEADTQKHIAEYKKTHPEASDEDVAHEAARYRNQLRRESTPPTPGQIINQEGHAAQYAESIRTIDSVLEVLRNYKGAAGLAGKVMRLEERLANVLAGVPDAERVQMMREIEFLRLQAPNLLLDRTGRPLSTEAGRINDIVAGTSAGDTGPNTIRALEALRERYERMQSGVQSRIGQGQAPAPAPAAKPAPSEKFWEGDKP